MYLLFFILALLMGCIIYNSSDPLISALSLVVVSLFLALSLVGVAPFWVPLLLILLFLSGVLAILTFISAISRPVPTAAVLPYSMLFIGWLSGFETMDTPSVSLSSLFSEYNLIYFYFVIIMIFIFLLSTYNILNKKGALRNL